MPSHTPRVSIAPVSPSTSRPASTSRASASVEIVMIHPLRHGPFAGPLTRQPAPGRRQPAYSSRTAMR